MAKKKIHRYSYLPYEIAVMQSKGIKTSDKVDLILRYSPYRTEMAVYKMANKVENGYEIKAAYTSNKAAEAEQERRLKEYEEENFTDALKGMKGNVEKNPKHHYSLDPMPAQKIADAFGTHDELIRQARRDKAAHIRIENERKAKQAEIALTETARRRNIVELRKVKELNNDMVVVQYKVGKDKLMDILEAMDDYVRSANGAWGK